MAKKCYAIRKGTKVGIVDTWEECQSLIKGYSGAEFRGFNTIEEAEAYKLSIVNKAQGDVARFNKILPEYNLAPEITKKRIFLETMEQVYAANPNVIINVKNNNQMIYLPLDKMINDNQKAQGSSK